MKREFLKTGDGSITIHLPEWNEQYHSKHGAINEAQHVFIQAGLHYFLNNSETTEVNILEIGFGTGLNALLSLLYANEKSISIKYTGVEAYPVAISEIEKLNYSKLLNISDNHFQLLHKSTWEQKTQISKCFQLLKLKQFFSDINDKGVFNLIYFDAFGARVQPELWTEQIFKQMFEALKPQGILVTYASKGSVRRAMQSVGFKVEKLPGPPGKREMLRAVK